ncbi:MAG: UPF0182 family protein [Nitrosopumilus sp.]|nr:UPF0182 family protein [Nitrosopumilus sp.]CAI9831727.1 conserved membrane hypothetical protein [Nitrosopumilaceae archaeon]MDA7952537.1 UPF0182 family protein [Nitrosopumilus sp.]MDA7954214.1 UPF0182 family protein [Nitrosopumilus sp.]MDA7958025.1 UPF0182 family protein [Nitrosopumilus sp.]
MYSAATERKAPPPDAGKYVRIAVVVAMGAAILVLAGQQAVVLSMNFTEFGDQFSKPVFYTLVSTLILASITLVRVNFAARSSIFWYLLGTAIGFIGPGPQSAADLVKKYSEFKMGRTQFAVWQVTKVLLFGAFFANIMFGFAAMSFLGGNTMGVESLPGLFALPFVTPPTDPAYAGERVVPMIPALLVLVPPILASIGLRLFLYVGVHRILHVATAFIQDSREGKPRYLDYVSTLEALAAIGIFWTAFELFFTSEINYNTRYIIGGALAAGSALAAFSVVDRMRARVLTHMFKRDVYVRLFTIVAILVATGGFAAVNDSIADARKIEYLGPYTAQQIGVNRHIGELDAVREITHQVELAPVSPNTIDEYVEGNADVLDVVRVWDWDAANAKLRPEIGLIPYVEIGDNDILRFNDTLYWTASMAPKIPDSVSAENTWYNEHLVYTHVPEGFLTLEATGGRIADSSELFAQRSIYYGEAGLFGETWSAYALSRTESTTDELGGAFYDGPGGLDLPPPLSWTFEPNFLLSYPAESVHIMRYKDIMDRMEVLYPYFLYNIFGSELDALPVTDGTNTYWLVPLIIGFDTRDVPWSINNPYLRLVGYALIDTYTGEIDLLRTGDDFFTDMFAEQYAEQFVPMPGWLEEQIRYPVELFNWKTRMYNVYHVTDVETFIQANEFYEVPRDLDTYYVNAKPPGFDQTSFIGLLSLELRGSEGRNLAGYMVVENDLPRLGELSFYEVPLDSDTKLIGPTAVSEALDRDPEFAQLKTLLRSPRVGDNILYRVGDHDVYFITVYTSSSAGGVVSQIGTIAAVGAAFNGEYFVGLGDTQESAFEAYLRKVSGVAPVLNGTSVSSALARDDRIEIARAAFDLDNITVEEPESVSVPLSFNEGEHFFYTENERAETDEFLARFIDEFLGDGGRILMWQEGDVLYFGTISVRDGLAELHYVTVEVGS